MKILLIDNFFYRRGGAEVVFLNTGELLKAHGHDVIYFSQKWDENIECESSDYFPEGVGTKSQGVLNKLKAIRNYFYNPEAVEKLELLIKKERPDIAHIHLFWGGISPSIFKVLKKYKVPIVHTAHDYRMVCPGYAFKNGSNEVCEDCKGKKFYLCIKNRCSKGSLVMSTLMTAEMYMRNMFLNPVDNIDTFMFVSNFSHNKHLQYQPRFSEKRCVTMYNFQDAAVLNEVDDSIDTFDSYFLFYGRLSYEKGIKTLIEAFSTKKVPLKIVGTGPLEGELKQFCKEKGCDNIEFLGFKTGKELFHLVRGAKFVCVPSECYENNPMTIIESYTLRTPVIGANLGGIPEIIDEGKTGYKFESGNADELAKVIDRCNAISENEYYVMKESAKRFADEKFGKEYYYNRLIELYNKTISDYKATK
ncbi:MAG: glycosyltransferase [Bacteroidales bacterium]|nr:glycosyltransferase [Bacteroidales bacterium]